MLRYALLGMAERTATADGAWWPTAERTGWSVQLDVAYLSGGASATVVLEVSPTQDSDTARTLATVTLNATGRTTKVASDLGVQAWDGYLRARVSAITGTVVFGVRAEAAFLSGTDPNDLGLLSKELRGFSGVVELVQAAEAEVVNLLVGSTPAPAADWAVTPSLLPVGAVAPGATAPGGMELVVDLAQSGVVDAIRAAVVLQAEHLFRRHKLSNSAEPSALVTLRAMEGLAPGVEALLRPWRPAASRTWRGR